MNRIISSLVVVAALAVPAVAAADSHVYTRVNQVATDHDDVNWYSELQISGVLPDGERAVSYEFSPHPEDRSSRTFESCERYAAMAMAKPGRYVLEVRFTVWDGSRNMLAGCTLRRVDQESRQ
jgi:hypothetical protein